MSDVLVVRPSSLGDIVYALAVVPDISRARPDARIDWVAERNFVPLVALCPDVRRVIAFGLRGWRKAPFGASNWREFAAFRRELREARYGAILDLQEQVKGALVARLAHGTRHGFDRASIREPVAMLGHDVHHPVSRMLHFVDRCRQLAAAALDYRIDGPPRWNLQVRPAPLDVPDRPYVVVLHATSRDDKLWPEAAWRNLLEAWDRAGLASVLPWGNAAEETRSRRLADGIAGAIVPGWLGLPEVASLLARAALAIGVDTGFTHLAAALRTPTIAIFAATSSALHGVAAAGPHARDLGGPGASPTADEVLSAAGEQLRQGAAC